MTKKVCTTATAVHLMVCCAIATFPGNGYISTDTLKEILKELDSKLTDEDLENIIEEVDEDGSGTLDFDEFMEMMAG